MEVRVLKFPTPTVNLFALRVLCFFWNSVVRYIHKTVMSLCIDFFIIMQCPSLPWNISYSDTLSDNGIFFYIYLWVSWRQCIVGSCFRNSLNQCVYTVSFNVYTKKYRNISHCRFLPLFFFFSKSSSFFYLLLDGVFL